MTLEAGLFDGECFRYFCDVAGEDIQDLKHITETFVKVCSDKSCSP